MASYTLSLLYSPHGRKCAQLCFCAEHLHVKPGKGAAFVRTKLKNAVTSNTVDKTFRAGESVASAVVEKKDYQYTYNDGNEVTQNLQASILLCLLHSVQYHSVSVHACSKDWKETYVDAELAVLNITAMAVLCCTTFEQAHIEFNSLQCHALLQHQPLLVGLCVHRHFVHQAPLTCCMHEQADFLLQYVFMDLETYEETRLARDESWAKYLKEGFTIALVVWNDKVSSPANANMFNHPTMSALVLYKCATTDTGR